jgi:hypothetical protein
MCLGKKLFKLLGAPCTLDIDTKDVDHEFFWKTFSRENFNIKI